MEIKKGRELKCLPRDYTIIDIETSGFSPTADHLIEVGCIKFRDGQEINRYSSLISPPCKVSAQIEGITGITNEMLANAPKFEIIARALWDYLADEILVGHNVTFDISFLYRNFDRVLGLQLVNDYVDTVKLCRTALPDLTSHRLSNICRALNLRMRRHRALNDCLILSKVIETISVKHSEPVRLVRGQKVAVTEGAPELLLKADWSTSGGVDVDAAVFLLDGTGRASADSAMIFYNQPRHPSGAVELLHVESGAQFKIRLSKVVAEKIDLTLTIYDADARRHTFKNLVGLNVSVCDAVTGAELIRYEPAEDYSCETAIVLCELYRHGAQWKFHAIGSGFSGGLSALVRNYGLEVKEKKESITALIASKAKAEVKMLAALRGCTMSELVNDALLEYLEGHREELNDALTSRLK